MIIVEIKLQTNKQRNNETNNQTNRTKHQNLLKNQEKTLTNQYEREKTMAKIYETMHSGKKATMNCTKKKITKRNKNIGY